ncbi:MAG: hypothetical protein V1798_06000 [Pseudomonadota bacterium]
MSRSSTTRVPSALLGVFLLVLVAGCHHKKEFTDTAVITHGTVAAASQSQGASLDTFKLPKPSDEKKSAPDKQKPETPIVPPSKEKPATKAKEGNKTPTAADKKPAVPPKTAPATKLERLTYVDGSKKCPKTDKEVADGVSLAVVAASDGIYLESKKAIQLDAKDSAPLFQKGNFLKAGGIIGNNYSKTESTCRLEVQSRGKKWTVDVNREFYVAKIEANDPNALNVHLKFKDNEENVLGVLCSKTAVLEKNKIKPLSQTYAASNADMPTVGDLKRAFGKHFVVCDQLAH